MKDILFKVVCVGFAIAVMFGVYKCDRAAYYEDNYKREKSNVETLIGKQKEYIINDSIHVAQLNAVTLSRDEFEELYTSTYKELKALKDNKHKEVEYITKYETITKTEFKTDTVYCEKDTCVSYSDNFTKLTLCPGYATVLTHDTLSQIISKHYKHHFLWWKWKVDGVTQEVYPRNPNSRIYFDEFIKIED